MGLSSLRRRAGNLLDLDDDELGRLQWREAHLDIDDAVVDVALRRRLAVAFDEIGLARRRALEGALAEHVLQEGAEIESDLRPQRLVIGLEHHPFGAAIE